MSSNQLKEAVQALAWIRAEGVIGILIEGGLGIRSQSGFQQRIITSEAPKDFGLLILLLERVHTRRESVVLIEPVSTVGGEENSTYPILWDPDSGQLETGNGRVAPAAQPIMLEWLGADLANPDWMPFSSDVLPPNFNADLFDAVAVLLPAIGGTNETIAGDFCVGVYKMPPLPDGTGVTVEQVLPVPITPVPPEAIFSYDARNFELGPVGEEGIETDQGEMMVPADPEEVPVVTAAALGAFQALVFGENSGTLEGAPIAAGVLSGMNQQFTMFSVLRVEWPEDLEPFSTEHRPMIQLSGPEAFRVHDLTVQRGDSSTRFYYDNFEQYDYAPMPSDSWYYYEELLDPSALEEPFVYSARQDGVASTFTSTIDTTTSISVTSTPMHATFDAISIGSPFQGALGEQRIYHQALTNAQRSAIIEELKTSWGIT